MIVYLYLLTAITRFKYFFAWNIGEMLCNASGLGFNGYSEEGKEKWDLINTSDIIGCHVIFVFILIISSKSLASG